MAIIQQSIRLLPPTSCPAQRKDLLCNNSQAAKQINSPQCRSSQYAQSNICIRDRMMACQAAIHSIMRCARLDCFPVVEAESLALLPVAPLNRDSQSTLSAHPVAVQIPEPQQDASQPGQHTEKPGLTMRSLCWCLEVAGRGTRLHDKRPCQTRRNKRTQIGIPGDAEDLVWVAP